MRSSGKSQAEIVLVLDIRIEDEDGNDSNVFDGTAGPK
jgi:hypothetical protein